MERIQAWWARRKTWQKIALVVLAVGLIAAPFVNTDDEGGTAGATASPSVTTQAASTSTLAAATTVATPSTTRAPTTTASRFTRSEENAIRKAEQYLDFSAFSRSGLIDQLEFEGFTNAEATLAVDYLDVDWNEQAWLKAEEYLDYSAFSRSGLIDQLEFEGFTRAQATYGVDKAGL